MTFPKMTITSIVLGLALLDSWSLGKDQPESEQTCCFKLRVIKELLGDDCGRKDCYDLKRSGHNTSGVYTVKPDDTEPFKVYCDMETDGGGWTVFQRREDGSVNFNRNWADYKDGFGELDGEHWLGNDKLFYLTNQQPYTLRIDMEDFENERRYAVYDSFAVADSSDHYRLSLGEYSGDAGNSMRFNGGQHFSTPDQDQDEGIFCNRRWTSGWWFKACLHASLNGPYKAYGPQSNYFTTINWERWHGSFYSLKVTEMKFRPSSAA